MPPIIQRCFLFLVAACTHPAMAQPSNASPIRDNPDSATLIFSDIAHFWTAFDKTFTPAGANAFNQLYIKPGSVGVQNFMSNGRIVSADTLKAFVYKNKKKYEAIRQNTLHLSAAEKQIRSNYYALKYLYPNAKFPPVYFVIGRFNTGGVAQPDYQIIGAEMNAPSNIPHLVAHELIHSNQNIPYTYRILLEQCIIEGSADFLGELISGKISNTAPYQYAKGKEAFLWNDFKKDMNLGENDSFANWLYGGNRKDARPPDMGYYIGYMITKAYYEKAADKKAAIAGLLNIKDCRQFLAESGYGTSF